MILMMMMMMMMKDALTSIIWVFNEVSLAADSDRSVSSCSIPVGTTIINVIVTSPCYLSWLTLAGWTGTLQVPLGSPEHLWWQSGDIIPHHHAHHLSLKMLKHTCNSCFVFSKLISRSCKENHQISLSFVINVIIAASSLFIVIQVVIK